MKTQNKHGVIFFLLAFAIVLIAFFSFFTPKSPKVDHSQQQVSMSENYFAKKYGLQEPQATNNNDNFFANKYGLKTQTENQEPQKEQGKGLTHGWDNTNSEQQNQVTYSTSTYSYTKNPSYNYHSYDDSNSDKYVYRTHSTEDTSSRTSNDYYQNTDSYSSPRSNYDDYSTSSNSYSAPMPQRQPSTITNCDGAGCWGSDGTRYNRGAGDTYFPTTGGSCQSIGGQMQCN